MTGEDSGYQPGVVEKVKCEYSHLGKVFNEGIETDDKNEGILKILEEGKKEEEFKKWISRSKTIRCDW